MSQSNIVGDPAISVDLDVKINLSSCMCNFLKFCLSIQYFPPRFGVNVIKLSLSVFVGTQQLICVLHLF